MEITVRKVKKRDGRIVSFNPEKITHAIFKAAKAVGGEDYERAKFLTDQVLKKLDEEFDGTKTPTVEEIQDIVEKVLIENGHAKTAKAYILYRQKKTEIREEKKKILNKEVLDEIDKRFSINALRVLAYRYLIKNDEGDVIESTKELFQRVALLMGLPDVLYDKRVYDKNGGHNISLTVSKYLGNLDSWDKKIKIGKYTLTKWHFERLISAFEEHANQGKMKVDLDTFIEMLQNGEFNEHEKLIDNYFDLMTKQVFMPNTPTIVNSGRKIGMLSACFTLDVEDTIESIMDLARDVALIQKAGGGTGMNFSKIRPSGDIVKSTMGTASGPVSFMKIIDAVSDVIKQGGVRRGANMGILEIWHPEIEKFISAKDKEGVLENFNISVGIWEDFWEYLAKDGEYPLISPHTKKVWKTTSAKSLLNSIAYHAWLKADPGVLFFDNINKRNVLINARGGKINVTNPCGEEPLYPHEACNLGSINVVKFIIENEDGTVTFDWEAYHKVIKETTRVLENVITMNRYPLPIIDRRTKETRRIGLGLMGVADLLFELGIKYNSKEGYEFMRKLAEHLTYYAYKESIELAKERGTFPIYNDTDYPKGKLPIELYYQKQLWSLDWDKLVEEIKQNGLRNAMVTTNAPTGSISMIADTSNGIEPMFSLVYEKNVSVGKFYYLDSVFEKKIRKAGLYNYELLKKIADNYGSVQGIDEIPKEIKDVFITSMDIHWLDHVVAQAVLQLSITDSISKTINMPSDVTVEDVKQAYLIAHEMGCKGTTVYRDGSKTGQVLSVTSEKKELKVKPKPSEYAIKWLNEILSEKQWLEKFIDVNKKKEEIESKPPILATDTILEKEAHKPIEKPELDKCPACGSKNLVYEAGCVVCKDCGWSECLIS